MAGQEKGVFSNTSLLHPPHPARRRASQSATCVYAIVSVVIIKAEGCACHVCVCGRVHAGVYTNVCESGSARVCVYTCVHHGVHALICIYVQGGWGCNCDLVDFRSSRGAERGVKPFHLPRASVLHIYCPSTGRRSKPIAPAFTPDDCTTTPREGGRHLSHQGHSLLLDNSEFVRPLCKHKRSKLEKKSPNPKIATFLKRGFWCLV